MKKTLICLLSALALVAGVRPAAAQGTAFTYQGQLISGGSPVSGSYDLTFTLYTNDVTGNAIAGPVTNSATGVTNGLFTTLVDFGANVFVGTSNWLSIGVRTNATGAFSTLAPRQPVTPTPYAIYSTTAGSAATATTASSAGTVAAVNITGTLGLTQLPAAVITNNATNVTLIGTFIGNGAGLTNVADWHLGGNTGTTNGNFLGTADGQPLEIRVGGVRVAWFSASNLGPNIVLGPAQNIINSNGTAGSSILGGSNNVIAPASSYSVLGGGSGNNIGTNAYNSVLGGGYGNNIASAQGGAGGNYESFIGGGSGNSIAATSGNSYDSVVVGGYGNSIGGYSEYAFVGGGAGNNLQFGSEASVVVGGADNSIFGNYNAIVGGTANYISNGSGADFIGGGDGNYIYGASSVIGGGIGNQIYSLYSTSCFIGGGYINYIGSPGSAGSSYSAINGGMGNLVGVGATYAWIGGGQNNTVSNNNTTVSGGYKNQAIGSYATVPGGSNNVASGANSFAAGTSAQATNSGAFVWADASSGAPFGSTTNNSFNVRATGGASFMTSGGGLKLDGNPVLTNGEPGVTLAGAFSGVFSGSFGGSGSGLTGLNASDLSSGTVPLAQLPASVVTNNEPGVSLGGLGLSGGSLSVPLPFSITTPVTSFIGHPVTLNIPVLYADAYENFSSGYGTGYFPVCSNNTASGAYALGLGSPGNNNTALGCNALESLYGGNNNVALGCDAGENLTSGNNDIYIGNNVTGSATESGVIRIGTTGVQTQTYLAGIVNCSSIFSGSVNSSGVTITGTSGLALPLPASIFAQGTPLLLADQNGNACFGLQAGSGTGSENTAVGDDTLFSNTSGTANVAVGYSALGNNSTDSGLVAVGYEALQNNAATGSLLTLGSANTAVGYQSLQQNTSGTFNTGLGFQTLLNNTSGANNTALGFWALLDNQTGTGNIGLGFEAGQNITGNNNIDIGNAGLSGDNGVIRIGTTQSETFLVGTVNCANTTNSGSLAVSGTITAGSVTSSGPISASALTSSGPTTCGSLTITGGSDLAEPFAISPAEQPVAEGAVVVIDAAHPGQLKLTDQPYDTRVAGVVSGANGIHPGIQMHQEGLLEGGRNVALTGRVYVQADTTNGAIQPGDMLTTSITPGRAMKVTDHARAQGAILGKAMTSLSVGQGMVLVLVTLQ